VGLPEDLAYLEGDLERTQVETADLRCERSRLRQRRWCFLLPVILCRSVVVARARAPAPVLVLLAVGEARPAGQPPTKRHA
jgi:hypothetical protein